MGKKAEQSWPIILEGIQAKSFEWNAKWQFLWVFKFFFK